MKLAIRIFIIMVSLITEASAMDLAERQKVISAYGAFLEKQQSTIGKASDLPYPKERIRQALAEELKAPSDPSIINPLEIGYMELESFVSDEEYINATNFETVVTSGNGNQPTSEEILSANPKKHISIQQLIIEREKKRLKEIQEFRKGRK